MKNLLAGAAGLSAILFGATLLLFLLPFAAFHAELREEAQGFEYLLVTLRALFGTRVVWPSLLGLGLVAVGVALCLQAAFPFGTGQREKGPRGRFVFWGLTCSLTLALLGLCVGITFALL